MADTMREALSAAFDKVEEKEKNESKEPQVGGSAPDPAKPVGAAPEESSSEVPTLAPEGDDKAKPEGVGESKPVVAGAKPEGAKPEGDDKTSKPAVARADGEPAPAVTTKAPQSWTPKAREAFAKCPPEAQAEITRRETEIQRGLSASANARRFGEEFHRVIAPYETLMRAQGANTPLAAIEPLLQTAAGLSLGSMQQKAQIVSNIIRTYGVDIKTLDDILGGQPGVPGAKPAGDNSELIAALDARLKPVMDFMGQVQSTAQVTQQQTQEQVDASIAAFAAKPDVAEFFEDVREDMADLLEVAAQRKRKISMEQAFEQACQLNPEIAAIVNKRKAAKAALAQNSSVERSKNAASSLPAGGPNGVGSGAAKDLRGAVSAAVDKHWNA